jgi:Fe-S cluster biogenesis protein NfuA
MEQEIKIRATPSRGEPRQCAFTIDRPVYPNRSYYFGDPEKARGSLLAEKIFELPGVESILVSHDTVTVTTRDVVEWPVFGRQVGAAIRSSLQSGATLVSDELHKSLPPAEVIREVVSHILDTLINPNVAGHGGFVQLIDVRENVVYLRLGGGCQGCGMADVTLRSGIERMIRDKVPEVGDILDTTDHAAGRNPFYAPAH